MKKFNPIIKGIIAIVCCISLLTLTSYAHSGRTDSNGGHRDTKNKSGLGSYHYHCGGHPAHLHPNGVCPYSSSSKKITSKPSTIDVTSIQINQFSNIIEVEETKNITATILPSNATDKNITWKTSDENIATISSTGMITAKKAGVVDITASTSNGKSSTIKLLIKEKERVENSTILNNSIDNNNDSNLNNSINNNNVLNNSTDNKDNSNDAGGILSLLGILGGGGYIGYKKSKKR